MYGSTGPNFKITCYRIDVADPATNLASYQSITRPCFRRRISLGNKTICCDKARLGVWLTVPKCMIFAAAEPSPMAPRRCNLMPPIGYGKKKKKTRIFFDVECKRIHFLLDVNVEPRKGMVLHAKQEDESLWKADLSTTTPF